VIPFRLREEDEGGYRVEVLDERWQIFEDFVNRDLFGLDGVRDLRTERPLGEPAAEGRLENRGLRLRNGPRLRDDRVPGPQHQGELARG
jgi:hypothetical protein